MSYPTSSSASDVWSLRDVYKAEAGGDWPALPSDANFANVSLLINADGLSDGSTAFVDESNNNHTITANGNAQADTTVFKYGGGSMQFDGTGDYLSLPDSDNWNFGSSDFTIEAWLYPVSYTGNTANVMSPVSQWTNGNRAWVIYVLDTSIKLFITTDSNTQQEIAATSSSINLNQWSHVAVVRESSTVTIYVNGVGLGTGSIGTSTIYNSTFNLNIGTTGNGDYGNWNGYIDDLRITKGVARYTANFTPPTDTFPTS